MPITKRVVPPQETFDRVVTHLRTQGCKAQFGGHCRYRVNFPPRKCAAGCLIPDTQYRAAMEGKRIETVLNAFPDTFGDEAHDPRLVADLQHIHDNGDIEYWEGDFRDTASRFTLQYTTPGI